MNTADSNTITTLLELFQNKMDTKKYVRVSLGAGAKVNVTNICDRNNPPDLKTLSLAAVESEVVKFKEANSELRLSDLCRERIRNHLLELDPHQNMFVRVPRLGLPATLARYLVHDMSIDDDRKE